VRNKFILFSVPRKQNRTRAPSPVEFRNHRGFLRRKFHFILRHSRRPQQPYHIRLFLTPQSHMQQRRVLPQISRCPCYFPLLHHRPRVHFHFCPNRALVVVQRLEIQRQPVVRRRSFTLQQHRRAALLRNH